MTHIGTPDLYLKTCDGLSQSGCDARIYQTAELALYDVIHSLIHYMPHKNKIAVIAQGSHLVEVATSLALKNQNQILYKKPHENTMAFLESLDSHTHLLYWSTEHEITGEVLYTEDQCQEILAVLNRKKIFSVQITYNSKISKTFSPEAASYAVIIQVPEIFRNQTENTVVYYSDKQKIPFGLAALQNPWVLNRPIATGFSTSRGVVKTHDVTALAVKEFLKLSQQDAFVAAEYPFWITDKWSTWWPEFSQGKEIMDHLLILSSDYIRKNPDYADQIQQAEQKIKQLSSWKVV